VKVPSPFAALLPTMTAAAGVAPKETKKTIAAMLC
jgi:hypothetical protein